MNNLASFYKDYLEFQELQKKELDQYLGSFLKDEDLKDLKKVLLAIFKADQKKKFSLKELIYIASFLGFYPGDVKKVLSDLRCLSKVDTDFYQYSHTD